MKKKWKHKTWKEKKKTFRIGAVVCIIFLGLSFIQTPKYEEEDLTFVTVVLTGKPKFKKRVSTKGSTSYWLVLPTKSINYEVTGIDYKYLKSYRFRSDIRKGDQLKFGVVDDKVFCISKNNVDYMQFAKAQFHKQQNQLFIRWLSSCALFLSVIPLVFKEKPKLKYNDGSYHDISFGTIFILGTIICFIIILIIIGPKFLSGSEFA